MNTIALCVVGALNVFSLPAGNAPVASYPPPGYASPVHVLDTSMLRDWVFIGYEITIMGGRPHVVPLGWVPYASLAECRPACETAIDTVNGGPYCVAH